MLRVHTHTGGSILTAQQPLNNVVRVTPSFSCRLGGTQSMATCAYDEALALPTEEFTLALRTQQIIAYQSGAADTIDPLVGSYYIEAMTDKFQAEAEEYIRKIDEMGGAKAIETGYMQSEIQNSAYELQVAIEKNRKIIPGVNKFQTEEKPVGEILKVDPKVRELQIAKIKELKASRDNQTVKKALAELKKAAEGTENLFPPIYEAVKAYATLGEISDVLRMYLENTLQYKNMSINP